MPRLPPKYNRVQNDAAPTGAACSSAACVLAKGSQLFPGRHDTVLRRFPPRAKPAKTDIAVTRLAGVLPQPSSPSEPMRDDSESCQAVLQVESVGDRKANDDGFPMARH
mmetsp:Transcript_91472/g.212742  ORF Transcript_91472/g.212742 Transcript_91472/m.212742 type:complete len:109 (-) Transcript_91472:89-415(-)|eukprot:CAMPEP_0171143874 /NCGR_PEP_ID=MMETSP0766_2-20121228/145003_1 /TAXON_ID=439317 /ORGANISM="Gambierdiscus australes, Strain CAWD 149" /LENGTH=108 /DNA_ID=CAMNT_0011607707 /DNA_START=238 /DNA_END=564 /DNA_ORIENTATION=-